MYWTPKGKEFIDGIMREWMGNEEQAFGSTLFFICLGVDEELEVRL